MNGVPYPLAKELVTMHTGALAQISLCPDCSTWILDTERKDFESFLNIQYAKHCEQEHS